MLGAESLAGGDDVPGRDLDRKVERPVPGRRRTAAIGRGEKRRGQPRPVRRCLGLALGQCKDELASPQTEVDPPPNRVVKRDLQAKPVPVEGRHRLQIGDGELHLEHADRGRHTINATPMRHQFATVHELARIQMLAGLPGQTLGKLADRMERRELRPGDVILESEDERGRFTVVISGMLRAPSGTVMRPGDTMGGLTLFDEPLRAMLPTTIASCDQATFDELVRPLITS